MKIINLDLHTSNLQEMKRFYSEHLELPLLNETTENFSVAVGETVLTFHLSGNNSQYHFAFNIPNNKVAEAVDWLSSKVDLIKYEEDQLIHFESWNAHSLYFEDPAGNIVEFIARHNLQNQLPGPFSYKDILNISEIGLPVQDVLGAVDALQSSLGVSTWRQPTPTFSTIGDENGLIIAVSKGRQWFMSDMIADYHPIKMTIETGKHQSLKHEGYVFISQ
jgi:catechol-2,3-dioxygenase